MQNLHIMNAKNRDARITISSLRPEPGYRLGLPDKEVRFRRYLAAGERHGHEALAERLEADYGQALVDGDPEIDLELVGRRIDHTDKVYLSASGEILYAPPKVVELILAPDGSEKERREPVDVASNVNEEVPVRWTGKKIPKAEAIRKFVFSRTVQLGHVDGLTFDYLFAMAEELAKEDVLMLLGAGKGGKDPLIFQANGSPYRGFLEGRVDGKRYMLLLHLSHMELKRPAEQA
ncbi:MAG: hypothetical protein JXR96_29770 [Deltaproteobacteria bacterium]|nr:hypothetical protein [Deltaproteobacteria bacterium]